jgi:hypothetical protein
MSTAVNDNQLSAPETESDAVAAAFRQLADQVGQLESAVRDLAARKDESQDYTETLGLIAAEQQGLRKAVQTLTEKPALKLTPDMMAREIADASRKARAEDQVALVRARGQMEDTATDFHRLIGTAASIRKQREHLLWAICGGAIVGALFWAFIPGMVARALPAGWLMPEGMAVSALGEADLWQAGQRLMRAGDPQTWNAIVAATNMQRDYGDAIAACEKTAAKAGKPVKCPISVKARPSGD